MIASSGHALAMKHVLLSPSRGRFGPRCPTFGCTATPGPGPFSPAPGERTYTEPPRFRPSPARYPSRSERENFWTVLVARPDALGELHQEESVPDLQGHPGAYEPIGLGEFPGGVVGIPFVRS